jgi:putative heme-binding domain-containing protein
VGYSYRWNEEQSDAILVGAKGEDAELAVHGEKPRPWRYPARAECMACHSRAANFVLGFTPLQLNTAHAYGDVADSQLRTLHHIGIFNGDKPAPGKGTLVNPYHSEEDLHARARSYLHVNCSVCHVEAGGGNARVELSITTKAEKMNLIGAWPQHDSFGIANAMLIAPGDPARSIVLQRISRRGRGQMPPLVTRTIDEKGVALIRDWIASMTPAQKFVREWKLDDLLPGLARLQHGRSADSGRSAFREIGCNQCHRFAGEGGTIGPDLSGIGQRLSPRDLLESVVLPSKEIADGFATCDIETKDGEVINGRIEREDDRILLLRQTTATDPPTEIRKADIRRRAMSQISNMPTGLLNSLEEPQILDLLAYLISDGKSEHPAFSPQSTGEGQLEIKSLPGAARR